MTVKGRIRLMEDATQSLQLSVLVLCVYERERENCRSEEGKEGAGGTGQGCVSL